jgi:hypothetical protein
MSARTPCLDNLLEAVGVSNPWADENGKPLNACPEGWTGVWDENGGYIAYFQHEADACAFRLFLITVRQQGKCITDRYEDSSGVPLTQPVASAHKKR